MEKETLIVGTYDGHLLLHNVDDNFTEIVGQVEGGVKCISPSPDGDLLGIITGFGQILVMTHDWDLLYETALEDIPDGVDVCKDFFPLFLNSHVLFAACLAECLLYKLRPLREMSTSVNILLSLFRNVVVKIFFCLLGLGILS